LLVSRGQQQDGKDILNWVDPKDKSGEFKRQQSVFRNWIEDKEGAEFPAEKGRYHLYVSYACPWGKSTMLLLLCVGAWSSRENHD